MPEVRRPGVLLVAEDDPDDQSLVEDAIAALDARVDLRFVENGEELLAYLRDRSEQFPRPDLILLDLNMPRKDGRSALREMKADSDLANLPVVILTTSRAEEDWMYCQYYHAEGYYQKPSSFNELTGILAGVLARYLAPNPNS